MLHDDTKFIRDTIYCSASSAYHMDLEYSRGNGKRKTKIRDVMETYTKVTTHTASNTRFIKAINQ